MCTLTLAWQVFPDAPVLVAANRDERRDRPSEPPSRTEADPAVVAPRDAEAGGTWIGYNDAGVFVGITNRWLADPAAERSRGLLVADALREPDARSAARLVERSVDAHDYDGFNLVVADRTAAYLFEWDGRLRTHQLDPGVHVVVNSGAALGGGGALVDAFGTPDGPTERVERATEQAENARAVRTALTPEPGEAADAWLDRAAAVLADHEYGVCIHENGYGTRSSSLIRLDDDGGSYRFADGPPCETPYRPVGTDESQV
ncbi:NRDE family protein [Haloplanus halophilus]|uniref:NRDE family protein n=1 Tax=Haloplanus halophilus TaxID=2949993 RepID=UPI00203C0C80|nr:NRDE family protein [Haloplanus sp. GDY1]